MKLVTLETPVCLDQDKNVTVTVIIGDGQIGGGNIKLDGRQVNVTPIKNFSLGLGSALKGKTLLAKTLVSDENPSTNKTSVTYLFNQDDKEQRFISTAEVENDGDSIGYWAKFILS